VINAWAAHVLGMTRALFFQPDYTSVNRFLCASGGERSVLTLNETAHLREA
jgi:probable phosphoglycerate mutase